jgi:hypothetical protein
MTASLLKIGIPFAVGVVVFAILGFLAFGNYWIGAVIGACIGLAFGVLGTWRQQSRAKLMDELFPGDEE